MPYLPERYPGLVGLPTVDLEMDEPLRIVPRPSFMPIEHPLSALARTDPEGARHIMDRLVDVEDHKVALGYTALAVDLRKMEIAAKVAITSRLVDGLIAQIQTHPECRHSRVTRRGMFGLFTSESITCESW